MDIRKGALCDLDAIAALETACFPPAEAASRESFQRRLSVHPECFWLMEEDGQLIAAVNGCCSNERDLRDEMFSDISLHDPDGDWLMIFGVETDPAYQHRGLAQKLLTEVIEDLRRQGRKGAVLTCKERLAGFYSLLGFVGEGRSESTHGGAVWYQMRLVF